jgi:hypothetical protein
MRWVCVVKTRKKNIYYYLNDYYSTLRRQQKCDDDATTTKRWVPLSPLDGFDVADTTVPAV